MWGMVESTTSLLTTAKLSKSLKLNHIEEFGEQQPHQQQTTDSSILSPILTNIPPLPNNYSTTSNTSVTANNTNISELKLGTNVNATTNSNTNTNIDNNSDCCDLGLTFSTDKLTQQEKQQLGFDIEPKLDEFVSQIKTAIKPIISATERNGNSKESNSEIATPSSGLLSSIGSTSEAFFTKCENNPSLNFIKNFTKEDITNSEIYKNIQDFFVTGTSKSSDIKSKLKQFIKEEKEKLNFAQDRFEYNQKQKQSDEKSVLLQQQLFQQTTSAGNKAGEFDCVRQQGDQNLTKLGSPVSCTKEKFFEQKQRLEDKQEEKTAEAFISFATDFSIDESCDLKSKSTSDTKNIREFNSIDDLGFQLRALNEKDISSTTDPWSTRVPLALPNNSQISTLSTELVNETLNYFVNCRQRLSQMTKTYDDNDAYIYLLQEKEVDLELAARIGQDLLKQNKQLKENIEHLEAELTKRHDDVQQLRHELNLKIALLETFIEEEQHQEGQHQNSFEADSEEELTFKQSTSDQQNSKQPSTSAIKHSQDIIQNKTTGNLISQQQRSESASFEDDDCCSNGFLSLNAHQRPGSVLVEPFSSLPHYLSTSESRQQLLRDDSFSVNTDTTEKLNAKQRLKDQEVLNQTVTFQLVESNKRLCELQDELFYKCEQNLMQQENIYRIQEQLRETERRLCDLASENELLQKSLHESSENQKEICDELQVYKRNFNELLPIFLELQKESRYYKHSDDNRHVPTSSVSLLEEIQNATESKNNHSNINSADEGDSGVHTNATPVANRSNSEDIHTDSEESTTSSTSSKSTITTNSHDSIADLDKSQQHSKRKWLGLSSFMLTTILILYLSVTLSSPPNLTISVPRLQLSKLTR